MSENTSVRENHRSRGQAALLEEPRGGRKSVKTVATTSDAPILCPRAPSFQPAPWPYAPDTWGHPGGMAAPVRSFEPLHAERIYLLGSLKQQKHDAAALLRKIAPLEKSLHEDRLPHVQKKTRKQLGWLKCRLGRATQQEQSILARLDYLNYEIQSKERWVQIEHERRQQEMRQQEQFFNYQQGLCHGMQQMQRMQMNPAQQEFQPWGYLPPLDQIQNTNWLGWQQAFQPPETPGTASADSAGLGNEHVLRESSGSGNVSPECSRPIETVEGPEKLIMALRSASMDDIKQRRMSMNMVPVLEPLYKRHSLPSLPGLPAIWQFTALQQATVDASEGEQGGEYVGFYVNP